MDEISGSGSSSWGGEGSEAGEGEDCQKKHNPNPSGCKGIEKCTLCRGRKVKVLSCFELVTDLGSVSGQMRAPHVIVVC